MICVFTISKYHLLIHARFENSVRATVPDITRRNRVSSAQMKTRSRQMRARAASYCSATSACARSWRGEVGGHKHKQPPPTPLLLLVLAHACGRRGKADGSENKRPPHALLLPLYSLRIRRWRGEVVLLLLLLVLLLRAASFCSCSLLLWAAFFFQWTNTARFVYWSYSDRYKLAVSPSTNWFLKPWIHYL